MRKRRCGGRSIHSTARLKPKHPDPALAGAHFNSDPRVPVAHRRDHPAERLWGACDGLLDRCAACHTVESTVQQCAGAWLPAAPRHTPVVRHRTRTKMDRGVTLAALDHGDLVRGASDKGEEHGPSKLDSLEKL